jgi:mannose-6-phosphate isomerase-like protein (cupin superfamily)
MIHYAPLTPQDREALASAPRIQSNIANTFDYGNVFVPKPWGGEYLVAQNNELAIWFLSIKDGQSTSMHCHEHKKTALVVMTGFAVVKTLTAEYLLGPLDAVLIDAGVFHSTRGIGNIRVIEAETPPMKGDLIRLTDKYGRTGSGYESPETYQRNPVMDVDQMQIQDCIEVAVRGLYPNGQNQGS